MILSPDFRDFIRSLNDNGVRYLVGGYAVAYSPGPTGRRPDNLRKDL